MITVQDKQKKAYAALKESLGIINVSATPRISKVVVSVGTGSLKDKKKAEIIEDRLAKITGQKPAPRAAKKSIASFKLRQGMPIGYQVTLRGARMYDFLDRLLNIALARTRDFRGVPRDSVDPMGNMTLGLKEHNIFPETADEEVKDVFGLAVTIVTTAKDKASATAYFEHLGMPFKKEEEGKKRRRG